MPVSRWTGRYSNFPKSYGDGDGEYNGDESAHSDDDISDLASQVLADLEAFFDHELCEEEDAEASEQESEGGSRSRDSQQNQWSNAAAISLEELSVVLNASIQRHQPTANMEMKASRVSSEREKSGANVRAKTRANGQIRQRSQGHELPFAHFQHLLEQKIQLFHDTRQESRRNATRFAPVREREKCQRQCQRQGSLGRWGSGSRSDGSSLASSKGEEEEEDLVRDDEEDGDPEEEELSEDEESVDSIASSVAASEGNTKERAARDRRSASLSPPAMRDALTQATLMQDQGQQTSMSKNQLLATTGMKFSMHPFKAETLRSQTGDEPQDDEEEFKSDDGHDEGDDEDPQMVERCSRNGRFLCNLLTRLPWDPQKRQRHQTARRPPRQREAAAAATTSRG